MVIGNKPAALHYGTESSTSESTAIAASTHRASAVMFAVKDYLISTLQVDLCYHGDLCADVTVCVCVCVYVSSDIYSDDFFS